jgi:prepilin-type N-terminal cleavage/methylation domain-containing protein
MSGAADAKRSGFTLLEVLIAIAIVALLALMGYRALSALSESESRLSAETT